MDRSARMGEKSIPELLVSFSVPAIIGTVVTATYNVVDRIFIGRGVGSLGIAGATVGFPIMLISMAFGMLIGHGANALVSIRLGEKKKEEADRIFGNAVGLLVLVSAAIGACGLLFLEPLLRLFGASDTILPYAREYMRVILAGTIFQSIGFGVNNFIRGEGNPKIAMITMIVGAAVNIALDPLFIFVLGMGMRGAAFATVISQAVSSAWVLSYFLGGKSLLTLRPRNLIPRFPVARRIAAVGSSSFAMQLAASAIHAVLNNQLRRHGGDTAISVSGIIFSVAMAIFMPLIGLNMGTQPIVGYNYGARRYDRVKKTLLLAIAAATVWVLLGATVVQLFPRGLILLFNRNDPDLLAMGTHAIRIFLLMLPIVGFQFVAASYFQAVGKALKAMILMLSRQVLLLIPLILVLPPYLGLNGIWLAAPIADVTSSLWTGLWLLIEFRHLVTKHAATAALEPRFAD